MKNPKQTKPHRKNSYIRGNIPQAEEKECKYLTQRELQRPIANGSCMLLLKRTGYNGYVVDWDTTDIVYKKKKL